MGVGVLLAFAALTFAIASSVHSGVAVTLGFATLRDPFDGAVVPEAVIAVLLVIRPRPRRS